MTVIGHIGLTPQSVGQLGGYRVQGKTAADARAPAGRCPGAARGRRGHDRAGDGARPGGRADLAGTAHPDHRHRRGGGCDGQVLVLHDLLGIFDRFTPKFVKTYAELFPQMEAALAAYRDDVAARRFPDAEHGFPMDEAEWETWAGYG